MALWWGSGHEASAQFPDFHQHPELYVQVADSFWMCRVTGGGRDTTAPEDIATAYIFEMENDSASLTRYIFGECRRNGERIWLDQWENGARRTTAAAVLSYNSRTIRFRMAAGDTLSFYRELYLYNPAMNRQLSNEYHFRDTLDYAVELVRPSDEKRLALLDSIGILASLERGTPVVYGSRPIMAKVEYVVPPEFSGDTAIMRVVLYNRGEGDYWFDRRDVVRANMSRQLTFPLCKQYLAAWGLLLGRPALKPGQESADDKVTLAVTRVDGSRNRVKIAFSTAPNGTATSIAIYDGQGRLLFYPFSSQSAVEHEETLYHFERSGLYFIGLLHNGNLVRTEKITITE